MNFQKTNKSTLFRLLKYVIPNWYLILLSTIAGVIKLFLPLVLPQIVKYFTDVILVSSMTTTQKTSEILKCLLFLILVYTLVYIPASFFRNTGAAEVANRITHKMRCEVYEHLQKMSAVFHHNNKSGDLVTRVNNDVEQVNNFIWNIATNVWIDSIMIIIYVYFMLSINTYLTIITVTTLPISIIATKKLREKIKNYSKKVQSNISSISGYMQERMAGYATIKLFGLEEHENQKFQEHSKRIYHCTKKTNNLFSMGDSITNSTMEIISSIVVCLAALYIVKGHISIGDLVAFYLYIGYFVTPIRRFSELNVNYAKSLAGIERVFEILDTPADIEEKTDAIDLNNIKEISFQHVFFKYDKEQPDYTLSDIDFQINTGEHVAIVGSSGCGKTSLVNLLTRFFDVDEGKILINGHNLRDYSLKSLYQNIGMVFQDVCLFSETIEENIRHGKLDANVDEIISAAKAANAYEFISEAPEGLKTMLGERGVGLSGGQKQRIAIARVFLKNPKLLILDEATSALDSESEMLVQSSLDKLMTGRTSIIIAHRLSTIVNADKIIVMDRGKIVEIGTHKELLESNGRYSELYRMQFKDVLA